MNWIDLIILALLFFGLIQGFIDGVIIGVAGLAALVLGIWGAIHFSWWTADKMAAWFDLQEWWTGVAAFGLTLVVILIGVRIIGRLLDTVMNQISLGFAVKLLGAAFGVLKTALILSLIFFLLNTINEKKQFLPSATISGSFLYKPISGLVPSIFPVIEKVNLPDSFTRQKKQPAAAAI